MVLVGYQDDEGLPGGGYFIARNSWGQGWPAASRHAAGHALISYDYARCCIYEAFAGEPLPKADAVALVEAKPGRHPASVLLDREARDVTGSLLLPGTWVLCVDGRMFRDTPRNRRLLDRRGLR